MKTNIVAHLTIFSNHVLSYIWHCRMFAPQNEKNITFFINSFKSEQVNGNNYVCKHVSDQKRRNN